MIFKHCKYKALFYFLQIFFELFLIFFRSYIYGRISGRRSWVDHLDPPAVAELLRITSAEQLPALDTWEGCGLIPAPPRPTPRAPACVFYARNAITRARANICSHICRGAPSATFADICRPSYIRTFAGSPTFAKTFAGSRADICRHLQSSSAEHLQGYLQAHLQTFARTFAPLVAVVGVCHRPS